MRQRGGSLFIGLYYLLPEDDTLAAAIANSRAIPASCRNRKIVARNIAHPDDRVCPQWAPIAQPIISKATVWTVTASGFPKLTVTFIT
jgi:hypothetical protein